jgi:hypothetical protein
MTKFLFVPIPFICLEMGLRMCELCSYCIIFQHGSINSPLTLDETEKKLNKIHYPFINSVIAGRARMSPFDYPGFFFSFNPSVWKETALYRPSTRSSFLSECIFCPDLCLMDPSPNVLQSVSFPTYISILRLPYRFLMSSQYAIRVPVYSHCACYRPSQHGFSWFSSVFKQILRRFPSFKLLLHD